ncbi:transmembrane BAX inhibitor motif containing 4 isoform 1 [Gracilaria domingensis]|nr:transmembrane BAX inhibitor motif containing 4 isoform 1 [Gracilaria domingensis]
MSAARDSIDMEPLRGVPRGAADASLSVNREAKAALSGANKSGFREDYANDFAYGTSVATCEPVIRLGFIRKVYGILAAQLALTVVICAAFMYITPLRLFVIKANGFLSVVSMIGTFGTLFALLAFKDSHPTNMQLLAAFTAFESFLVGSICAQYEQSGLGGLVLEALVITLAVFSGLTLYAFASKKDFSFMGGALYAALMGLLVASIVNLFIGFTGNKSPFLAMLISYGGALLFSLYILYDSTLTANQNEAKAKQRRALFLFPYTMFLTHFSYCNVVRVFLK